MLVVRTRHLLIRIVVEAKEAKRTEQVTLGTLPY